MRTPFVGTAAWRVPAAALAAALVALCAALLLPRAFSDPVAVDPFAVRVAVVALLLLGVAALDRRLAGARPVLLSIAAIAAPFCLWLATPDLLARIDGRLDGDRRLLGAGVAQMVLTLAFAVAAMRLLPRERRPPLRLGRAGPDAAAAALGGSALLLGLAMALPATILGRVGIPPLALARDLPWLGPADALQAAAQEVQFRGLLMGSLERAGPFWAANLGQGVVFGLAHIAVQYEGPAGPFVPVTVALGVALGWVTRRTGSLWPAIVVHAVLDIAAGVAVIPGLYGL